MAFEIVPTRREDRLDIADKIVLLLKERNSQVARSMILGAAGHLIGILSSSSELAPRCWVSSSIDRASIMRALHCKKILTAFSATILSDPLTVETKNPKIASRLIGKDEG